MRHHREGSHNSLIHKKLSTILMEASKDPRFVRVTISRVEAAKDFSFAKIYVSTFPPENVEDLIQALNRAAGFFSHTLGKALKTRNTPKLVFVYDAGFDYSVEMETRLKRFEEPSS